jgi:peptide chain release factor subunit 1
VISLYLNTQVHEHGRRTNLDAFVRKEFKSRSKTWPLHSTERESFEKDAGRIQRFVNEELDPAAKGAVIFACAAIDFWEVLQLDMPVDENRLYVYDQPHLYGLARLSDEHPRYAAVIADTNYARIYVFGFGRVLAKREIENVKTRGTVQGGWSQARFQRHIENYHLQHVKEVIDALERIVAEERIDKVVLSGDEVVIPLLREQMPKHLAEKIIDVLKLDVNTPEHEVLRQTLEAMRRQDVQDDSQRVERLLEEYRSGGLAVAGPRRTLAALAIGQVDELFLSATLDQFQTEEEAEIDETALAAQAVGAGAIENRETRTVLLPDEFVTKAGQTGARITFIEDPVLLAGVGGVGARLRYRV